MTRSSARRGVRAGFKHSKRWEPEIRNNDFGMHSDGGIKGREWCATSSVSGSEASAQAILQQLVLPDESDINPASGSPEDIGSITVELLGCAG